MQRIEGFHAGNKAGIHYSLEHTRLLDQDPSQGEYTHDGKQKHAGLFGAVTQIQRRDDGTVQTTEKETGKCCVQQLLYTRLQLGIELHHQENQNERRHHGNQGRRQNQQLLLDHVILFPRRQGEQIEETVIFLVIEDRGCRGRDEKECHENEI